MEQWDPPVCKTEDKAACITDQRELGLLKMSFNQKKAEWEEKKEGTLAL